MRGDWVDEVQRPRGAVLIGGTVNRQASNQPLTPWAGLAGNTRGAGLRRYLRSHPGHLLRSHRSSVLINGSHRRLRR